MVGGFGALRRFGDAASALVGPAIVALILGGCAGSRAEANSSRACRSEVRAGVLPLWARTGFSAPRPRMPHAVGASHGIAAIVWADPLVSPPARDRSNKILWVSRKAPDPGSDLRIAAQRMAGSRPLGSPVPRRVAGGPGPSIIDLPAAGCWRLTLRWSGRVDRLDLRYAGNR